MTDILPMFLFGVASALTPGPNNFMIMNSGLKFGVKRSIPHYLGICFGFPLMVLVIALGLGAVFLQYDWLKQGLKIVGCAYMVYLSWKIVTSVTDSKDGHSAQPFSFLQAFMFQWVNPKAWLMAIGAISIFTMSTNAFHNALALSTIFLLVCLPSLGVWLMGGTFLKKVIHNAKQERWFNGVMAACLLASITMIFID
jgi:threonine/homoserine/homoserine lactone efflux protein